MDPLTFARAAERVGTPFYLYDAEVLRANGRALLSAFGCFRPHYSLKANPCPGLCALVSSMGFGAEVSSRFEAEIALRTGFDPAEMLYDGPAKTVDEIGHGLLAGIRRFNFESPAELGRIRRALAETGVREPLHLCARVNPERSTSAGEVMTGRSSRFGMDEETLEPLLRRSRADGSTPSGIHLYIGSQILDAEEIARSLPRRTSPMSKLRAISSASRIWLPM